MKFFRIDLLTLLISLFILSSCKNQDGIGLSPDNALSGTLAVDTNIVINTVKEDSTYTNALPKTPLGYFNDPQIGTTESNIAMVLNLPLSSAYTLPTGTITIDSAVLVMRYADGFYGDSLTSKYKVNVYQLTEKPLSTVNYYNTRLWAHNTSTLLGTKTFVSRTHTGFKINDIVSAAKDTPIVVQPQIRIPISKDFINTNLFTSSTGTLTSNTVFQDAVKGLYLTMDKGQAGAGGNFMMAVDSSNLAVYYRTDDGAGTIDTSVVTLPISTHVAEIKHTYTATVQAVIDNQATSNSTFYLQGLLGLRAKISFPNLQDIVTKAGGNIVINRAELVVTPTAGSTIPFTAQYRVSMYQLDIALQRTQIRDARDATSGDPFALGATTFGGFLTTNNDYHFLLTAYIQDLLLGRTKDYGTYLGVIDNTNTSGIDYLATPQTGGRLIAAGTVTDKTSANFPYKIKLNIIYTKVTK